MTYATDFTTLDHNVADMILYYFNPHCKLNTSYNVPKAQFFRPEGVEEDSTVLSELCEGYIIGSDDENSSNSCLMFRMSHHCQRTTWYTKDYKIIFFTLLKHETDL